MKSAPIIIGLLAGIGLGMMIEHHRDKAPALTVISQPEDEIGRRPTQQDIDWLKKERKQLDQRFDESINTLEARLK